MCRLRLSLLAHWAIALGVVSGCDPDRDRGSTPPVPLDPSPDDPRVVDALKDVDIGATALRRLSHRELEDTIRALTGVDASALIASLPADALTPFDNDADTQLGSLGLVESLSSAASAIAEAALARPGGPPPSLRVSVEAEDSSAHVARVEGSGIYVAPGDAGFVVFLGEAGLRLSAEVPDALAGAFTLTVTGQGIGADDPRTIDPHDDVPLVEVRVDGLVATTLQFPDGIVVSPSLPLTLTAGRHDIDVVFANDFYDPASGLDRNLALDRVELVSVARVDDDRPGLGPSSTTELVGCVPSGLDDAVCFSSFVASFGRRALRRPLSAEELSSYAALQQFSIDEGDFLVGIRLVITAMLQEFDFLYRIEAIDTETAEGSRAVLDDFAIASRLSFLLWGQGPDDALLDDAAAGRLRAGPGRRAIADRLLQDPRARARVARLHAMWLGTEDALTRVPPALRDSFERESRALIERVIFDERRSWLELFTATESLIDDVLAEHYGLPLPGAPTWVSLVGTGRAGLLGHAAFLAVGNKFDDTSPTQRGKAFRARLLCTEVRSPTPEDLGGQTVNTDMPPEGGGCKRDRYAAHTTGNCRGCHSVMDPIGFGLEQYDKFGRFRTVEPATEPSGACPIDGRGDLDGAAFSGPAELGARLVANPAFTHCFSRQFLRFAWGRHEQPAEEASITALDRAFAAADFDFIAFMRAVVASESFATRVMPTPSSDSP